MNGVDTIGNDTLAENMTQFWTAFCENKGVFITCYNGQIADNCTDVGYAISYSPSEDQMRDEFNRVCSNVNGLVEYLTCFQNTDFLREVDECDKNTNTGDSSMQCQYRRCLSGALKQTCTTGATTFFNHQSQECSKATTAAFSQILVYMILLICFLTVY